MKALLDNLNLNGHDNELRAEPTEDAADHLCILHQRLTNGRENALRPGMLAVWKPGLKNCRFPRYGEPAVVIEVLDPPLINHKAEAWSPYYREPLDLLLGILYQDNKFLAYHFDSRRFQPYEGSDTPNR
ncbi:MAG: hypothetical protein IAF00_10890 [Phycisphaerales bacterium]|nr:hypothetical protein [Phycisphaerales bacterium]